MSRHPSSCLIGFDQVCGQPWAGLQQLRFVLGHPKGSDAEGGREDELKVVMICNYATCSHESL